MDKLEMRNWVASLEGVIDNKLMPKWVKHNKIEEKDNVQLRWQFLQAHFQLDVFWRGDNEVVELQYLSPHTSHSYKWFKLNDDTFNEVQDRIGNIGQRAMWQYHDQKGFDG
jgi:hypothetical protein